MQHLAHTQCQMACRPHGGDHRIWIIRPPGCPWVCFRLAPQHPFHARMVQMGCQQGKFVIRLGSHAVELTIVRSQQLGKTHETITDVGNAAQSKVYKIVDELDAAHGLSK